MNGGRAQRQKVKWLGPVHTQCERCHFSTPVNVFRLHARCLCATRVVWWWSLPTPAGGKSGADNENAPALCVNRVMQLCSPWMINSDDVGVTGPESSPESLQRTQRGAAPRRGMTGIHECEPTSAFASITSSRAPLWCPVLVSAHRRCHTLSVSLTDSWLAVGV